MGKRIPPFGFSDTDAAVMRWLKKKGINSNEVLAYTVQRSAQDSTISLLFMLDDDPAVTEKEE